MTVENNTYIVTIDKDEVNLIATALTKVIREERVKDDESRDSDLLKQARELRNALGALTNRSWYGEDY